MTFHLNSVRNMSGGLFEVGEHVLVNGREAIINDASEDGDAIITHSDGTIRNVKWRDLILVRPPTFPN